LPNSPNDHAASASFLNHGTVSGNGSIKIERYIIQYFTETDGWHFFSSPVDNANIDSQFLPGVCDDLYIYKEISDEWLSPKTTPDLTYFVNGLGYLISYINNSVHTISGVPNNNDLKFNNLSFTGDRGWHLLGNPYPCGLKWGGTDWGINGISLVAKLLNSGGTYTDLLAGETIPAMNGFFVKANSTSNAITIPKSARLHSIADGWKRTESSLDKKMKLMIQSNTDNTFAETRIIVNHDATTGYDISKDSPYLSGMPGTPLFYQVTSDGRELSTNCIPDSASLKLNFEFTPGLANEYTLKAVISDEWAKTSNFVFEDKLSNVKYPILNGTTFKFKSNSGDIKDRFRLAIDIITGITKKENIEDLNISCADRHVKISMPHQIDSGRAYIFDLVGKQVFSGEFVNGKLDFKLPNSGFYLLHVLVKNGMLTRKILAL
ncbi:MAG: hypothetical protein Q8908_16900, partial [Bacteroidota bacterium]|nr:hypothetical protein [Bacteroidota bacterium]